MIWVPPSVWIEKPPAVIAGLIIGIAAVVMALRIRHAPPRQAVAVPEPELLAAPQPATRLADDVMAATRSRAALNRDMALHAAALGSSMGARWH